MRESADFSSDSDFPPGNPLFLSLSSIGRASQIRLRLPGQAASRLTYFAGGKGNSYRVRSVDRSYDGLETLLVVEYLPIERHHLALTVPGAEQESGPG